MVIGSKHTYHQLQLQLHNSTSANQTPTWIMMHHRKKKNSHKQSQRKSSVYPTCSVRIHWRRHWANPTLQCTIQMSLRQGVIALSPAISSYTQPRLLLHSTCPSFILLTAPSCLKFFSLCAPRNNLQLMAIIDPFHSDSSLQFAVVFPRPFPNCVLTKGCIKVAQVFWELDFANLMSFASPWSHMPIIHQN